MCQDTITIVKSSLKLKMVIMSMLSLHAIPMSSKRPVFLQWMHIYFILAMMNGPLIRRSRIYLFRFDYRLI